MLGAAHSAANPLTARFGVVHGQAVGMLLPHVVRFNGEDLETRASYAELAKSAGVAGGGDSNEHALQALLARLESLLKLAGFPHSFADCGVKRDAIPALAEDAAKQWTATFNPREVTAEDFARLYESAF